MPLTVGNYLRQSTGAICKSSFAAMRIVYDLLGSASLHAVYVEATRSLGAAAEANQTMTCCSRNLDYRFCA